MPQTYITLHSTLVCYMQKIRRNKKKKIDGKILNPETDLHARAYNSPQKKKIKTGRIQLNYTQETKYYLFYMVRYVDGSIQVYCD